ncbi:MAG: ribonuclease HII [Bacteroidia bacterium]
MKKTTSPLALTFGDILPEAGVDEAGRGCLAGPVVAAAAVLPSDFSHPFLTDSKKLSQKQRDALRPIVEQEAVCWAVGIISAPRIDEVNILNATYEAMHEAVRCLKDAPAFLVIDGNRFRPFPEIPHTCAIKGDGRFLHVAAASILAKTYRDEIMHMLHEQYPHYGWDTNMGYPTKAHKAAIAEHGPTPFHRRSFNWEDRQLKLFS